MDKKKGISGIIFAAVGAAIFVAAIVIRPGEGVQGIVYTSNAVQIPQVLVLAFNGLLFALLMAGFTWVLTKVGLDLTSYATPLAGTLSAFLLGLAQNWINLLPVQYDPIVQMILNVLVVVVGGIGTLYIFANKENKSIL